MVENTSGPLLTGARQEGAMGYDRFDGQGHGSVRAHSDHLSC